MKIKNAFVGVSLIVLSTLSVAGGGHGHGHRGSYSGRDFGLGLIIGTLGTALIYRSQPPVVVAPPGPYYAEPYYGGYMGVRPLVPAPSVVYLRDGTMLTYSYQSGLWVDPWGRAYTEIPRY